MNHSLSSTVTGKTKIKIVFLGGQSVGKSSIIEKYIHDRFQESANPTVGIDFLAKNITHKAKNYRLQLWDTAGQQRFRSLIPSYLKDAHCALVVFDVSSTNSFSESEAWINLFNENKNGDGFVFLVGNKIDLEYRQVTAEEAKKKADQLKIPYFQISAKTGDNVEDLFFSLVDSSQQKPANGLTPLAGQKDVIKQEQGVRQEQQVKVDETGTKIQANEKQGVVASENVVLKNQKIAVRKDKNKNACC